MHICTFINMYLYMRTTIDMPDDLMARTRPFLAERNMTFRALVIDAIERTLAVPSTPFQLRDASAGSEPEGDGVSGEAINQAIDELRTPGFRP